MFLEIVKKFDFVISGGSDFYGENKLEICIGVGKGNLKIDDEIFYVLESRVFKL